MSEIVKSLKAWNNFANGGPRPEGPLVRYEEAANEVESLEQRISKLELALTAISLCAQNSMSSKHECGVIARKALEPPR